MKLPPHSVVRRGRAFDVIAEGSLVGGWTDCSAATRGVYLWREGAGWTREMVLAAVAAAIDAGDVPEADEAPGGGGEPLPGPGARRGGPCCDCCGEYTDLEPDWGYCRHRANRIAHPADRPCVYFARRYAGGAGAAPKVDVNPDRDDEIEGEENATPRRVAGNGRPAIVPAAGDFGHLQDRRQLRLL